MRHQKQRGTDRDALATSATTLQKIHGIGVVPAAKLPGHVSDITRLPSASHFASYTGAAPLDASSGYQNRHGLNTGGNRQFNPVLNTMAVCHSCDAGPGRDCYLKTSPKEKHLAKPAEHPNDVPPTSSTTGSSTTTTTPIKPPLDIQRRYQGFLSELLLAECNDRDGRSSIGRDKAANFPRSHGSVTSIRYGPLYQPHYDPHQAGLLEGQDGQPEH